MDIWAGLRSPAQVGMYPLGLADIWAHHAAANIPSTRFDGSPNPLAMPVTFQEASEKFRRAVIVSLMLGCSEDVYKTYADKIERGDPDPYDYYCRALGEITDIINAAVGKLSLLLMEDDRAVIPMTNRNAEKVAQRGRSEYRSGRYHGPANSHWPQISIAVMTGLMQFGVNRLPFRDEVWADGSIRRLCGRYVSLVIFDQQEPGADGGLPTLDADRMNSLIALSDYTRGDSKSAAQRYCTYNLRKAGGESLCGRCLDVCPSGALANSSPRPDGSFEERLSSQTHRFWNGIVDFDAANCCRERGQKAQVFEEYVCARCEAICAARGIRKSAPEIEKINGLS
jgi:ferredoxin